MNSSSADPRYDDPTVATRSTRCRCGARRLRVLAAAIALMPSAGCYDAAALLKSRREAHDAVAHEEIDLGKFSIVLPHAAGAAGGKKIEFHAFGHVARSDRSAVSGALTDSAAKLHSHMLMSVRSLSSSELEDPQLDSLRRRIAEVVNSSLDGQRIENVGFYEFTLATNEPQ